MLLKDKVALVAGSTHNIGLAIARAFAREGAKVIIHSRHEIEAKQIAAELSGDSFVADMADGEQITALFEHVKSKHGRLDILVNSVSPIRLRAACSIRLSRNGAMCWRST